MAKSLIVEALGQFELFKRHCNRDELQEFDSVD